MVDDLSDALKKLRELQDRVRQLETAIPLENASVTEGRVRFIGGTLRVDSGGRVEIVGTLHVEGTTQFIGNVTLQGPWTFSGDGDITGDVTLSGDMTVDSGGEIRVGTSNVLRIRRDGANGIIEIGDSRISITPSGAVSVSGPGVSLQATGGSNAPALELTAGSGVVWDNIPQLPSGSSGGEYLVILGGQMYRAMGGGGGPGGGGDPDPGEDLGNFQWPFSLSTVTSEYGPRTAPYIGFHEGIDFGLSPATAGASIIAAGDGTVAVNTFSAGWGNYVRITHTVNGQQLSTLYAHMNAPGLPPVGSSVSKGDVIGYVGNTGNSYGAHLHWECWMGTSYGTHVNPRAFMAAYGPD